MRRRKGLPTVLARTPVDAAIIPKITDNDTQTTAQVTVPPYAAIPDVGPYTAHPTTDPHVTNTARTQRTLASTATSNSSSFTYRD